MAQSSDEVRVDGAWRDTIYANAAVANLARQSFCERNYARTRSRICCQIGQSFLACKRAHVDNPAPSRAPHERENLARHLEHPNEVYLEDVVPFGRVELLEGLISAEISSIVHKNIDARRLPARLPEGSCNFIGLRHIDPEGLRAVKFDWIDVPSPDLSAKSYELRCDLSARAGKKQTLVEASEEMPMMPPCVSGWNQLPGRLATH